MVMTYSSDLKEISRKPRKKKKKQEPAYPDKNEINWKIKIVSLRN